MAAVSGLPESRSTPVPTRSIGFFTDPLLATQIQIRRLSCSFRIQLLLALFASASCLSATTPQPAGMSLLLQIKANSFPPNPSTYDSIPPSHSTRFLLVTRVMRQAPVTAARRSTPRRYLPFVYVACAVRCAAADIFTQGMEFSALGQRMVKPVMHHSKTCARFNTALRMSIDLKSAVKVAGVMTQGRNSDCGCNQVRVHLSSAIELVQRMKCSSFLRMQMINSFFSLPICNALQWVNRFSIDYSTDNSKWDSLGNFPGLRQLLIPQQLISSQRLYRQRRSRLSA